MKAWVLAALAILLGFQQPIQAQELESSLPFIHELKFSGNESFGEDKLRQQLLLRFPEWTFPAWWRRFSDPPRFQRSRFLKELDRIEAFYLREGFANASAVLDTVIQRPTLSPSVDLLVKIREGPRTRLRSIRYAPQAVFSLEELRQATPIANGQPFPYAAREIGRLTRSLKIAFQTRGYLEVAIRDSSIVSADSTEGVLIFTCEAGPLFRIRKIAIGGNENTKTSLVQRELRFKPGEVYNIQKIQDTQQALYNTSLFRRVIINERNIDIQQSTVDIFVDLTERRMAFVEGSVGVGKRDEYEVRVIGRWGHRNLLGRGNSLEFSGTVAYNIEQLKDNFYIDGRSRFVEPRFFGTETRFAPEVGFSEDRRIDNVELQTVEFELPWSRSLGRFSTISAGLNASVTQTTLEGIPDNRPDTRSILASFTRNTSDNIFEPRRGQVWGFTAQRAGFGGENQFTRLTAAYANYLSLGSSVLALGLRTGWVEAYGESRKRTFIGISGVAFPYLFQAGGNTTIRGFENSSLGDSVTTTQFINDETIALLETTSAVAGGVLLIGNVELRMPFPFMASSRLRSVLFVDCGNVWADMAAFRNARFGPHFESQYFDSDIRYSYGVGLRYPTPFGPIRIDFGFPFKRWAWGRPHIGLGHPF